MRRAGRWGWQFFWGGPIKDKRLHLQDTAVVYAWPSTGGRFELQNPGALELDVLRIEDPFTECNRSYNTIEEDAFVHRLRRLGGIFFEHQYGTRTDELRDNEVHTWLGWPEDEEHKGGVWMVKVKYNEVYERRTGRIRLAKTMQDRCRAIEMCGGVFYATPTEEHLVPMKPIPYPNGMTAHDLARLERSLTCES